MPQYAFTFKKDDIFVEFLTTDKLEVEKQFQIWVDCATEYTKSGPKKKAKSANAEATPNKTAIMEEKPIMAEPIEEKTENTVEAKVEQKEQPEEVFDKASSLLKTINSIQSPIESEEKPAEKTVFEEVLEKTIENPPETPIFEPNRAKDQVFLNLVNSKNTSDKFHYLMITAYYLSEFEKLERFSLKQINAKLMQNLSEVIDHTMLQDAINQNFIELIPDLTGTSEVGEYRLTHQGEEFFANKI